MPRSFILDGVEHTGMVDAIGISLVKGGFVAEMGLRSSAEDVEMKDWRYLSMNEIQVLSGWMGARCRNPDVALDNSGRDDFASIMEYQAATVN